jgi:hypothetical protein
MFEYYAYLSMYDYVISGCALLFHVGVILCLFILYHYILSHDNTCSFRNFTFCKIVQMSSHMHLSMNCVLVQSMHIFRGAPCTNLENKTL